MAVMPGVEYQPTQVSLLMSRYDILCFHTIVGNDPAPAAHFSVRANGHIIQSRDTKYRSAANFEGNHRCLAVETDDHGPEFGAWNVNDGHAVPAWTAAQCESNARLAVWAYRTHGVPLVLAPDSKPTSRGIAYHRMGSDSPNNFAGYAYGGRVPGGERWTTSAGKVCPGDRRIRQLIEIVIPRARVLAGLQEEEDVPDFTPEQADLIYRFARDCYPAIARLDRNNDLYGQVTATRAELHALAGTLSDDEANIIAAVRAHSGDAPTDEQIDDLAARLSATLGASLATELGRRLLEGSSS